MEITNNTNRRIKFRAWSVKEKRYYYGVERAYDHIMPCTKTGDFIPATTFDEISEDKHDYWIAEQFTGFLDKNGTEIYEGDIVGSGRLHHIVVFRNGCFKLKLPYMEATEWSPDADIWGTLETMWRYAIRQQDELFKDYFEVIGNIHNELK